MYCILAKHLPFVFIFKKKKLEKWYSEMRIPTNEDLGDMVLDLAVINCIALTMRQS